MNVEPKEIQSWPNQYISLQSHMQPSKVAELHEQVSALMETLRSALTDETMAAALLTLHILLTSAGRIFISLIINDFRFFAATTFRMPRNHLGRVFRASKPNRLVDYFSALTHC